MIKEGSIVNGVLFRTLTKDHKEELKKLMKIYLEDEPVTKQMKLTEEDTEAYVEFLMESSMAEGNSLGMFDAKTGRMCGCCVYSRRNSDAILEKYNSLIEKLSENFKKLSRFDEFVENILIKALKTTNVLWIDLGVITPEYRGRKLTGPMNEWAEQIARKHGCYAVAAVALVSATIHSSERSGFVTLKKIYYKDYQDPVTGEAVLDDIPAPHTHAIIGLKKITYQSNL